MSTNPFRRTDRQQDADSQLSAGRSALLGDSSRSNELCVDTRVPSSSLERHVSFASPPVDGTYAAVSYPSSPESTRYLSPTPASRNTPNYRSDFSSDSFLDLDRSNREDQATDVAASSTSNNVFARNEELKSKEDAVKDMLSRFAPGPTPGNRQESGHQEQPAPTRQSLDVNAFTRLLMTGNTSQLTETANKPAAYTSLSVDQNDVPLPDDATATSDQSISKVEALAEGAFTSMNGNRAQEEIKVPPAAPAPRRSKSIKQKGASSTGGSSAIPSHQVTDQSRINTPPDQSNASGTAATTSNQHDFQKSIAVPPPPPMRRHNSSARRRSSNDLETTVEEYEPAQPMHNGSRRVSADRPVLPPSSSSSTSTKRQSVFQQPPPLPPPRRGRGSSRSSMDSFRPSLSSITGEAEGEMSASSHQDESAIFSSRDIFAELASLQAEVDAARRGA